MVTVPICPVETIGWQQKWGLRMITEHATGGMVDRLLSSIFAGKEEPNKMVAVPIYRNLCQWRW